MLLRLAYLGVTNAFAMLRLLPMSDRAKDAEILALRHQMMVLERHLGAQKVRFDPSDRAFLAALLHRLPTLWGTETPLHRLSWAFTPHVMRLWEVPQSCSVKFPT